jgi:HD-like signal output (HDOD) protein
VRRSLAWENLPSSVRVAQKALEATLDPLCANERVQHILMADPGASAGTLRLANSAYFGVQSQIRTLALAVAIVGRRRLSPIHVI